MKCRIMVVAVTTALVATTPQNRLPDDGYEVLFQDSPDPFDACWSTPSLPAYATGTYIIGSTGQFGMGDRKFVGVLDAFGKWNKFVLDGGKKQICGSAAMINSSFYRESVKQNTITPGILFFETDPPRHCPLFNPICNMLAPSDNVYVVPMKLGGEAPDQFTATTDAPIWMDYENNNLGAESKLHNWTDGLCKHEPPGGCTVSTIHTAHTQTPTAHLIQREGKNFGIMTDGAILPFQKTSYIMLYEMDQDPGKRSIIASMPIDHVPYLHSYGLTDDFAVLPLQPISVSLGAMARGKMMNEAFAEIPGATTSQVCLLARTAKGKDLIGIQEYACIETPKFFYVHVVNAFQNASGVVLDVAISPDDVLLSPASSLPITLNRTARNSIPHGQRPTVTRFYVPLGGGSSPLEMHRQPLSVVGRLTEMPAINPHFQGKPYCIYYALEWFHNDKDYGSMGLVRQDVCAGKRTYFAQPNLFFSEAGFIPEGPAAAESSGLLAFTALDGIKKKSYYMVLDAATLEVKEKVELPKTIPFTIHHNWWPEGAAAELVV